MAHHRIPLELSKPVLYAPLCFLTPAFVPGAECGSHSLWHCMICAAAPGWPWAQTPLTFTGLSFEDLQVTVGHLQLLAGHDLALDVTQGDAVAMKCDHVIAQLGGELVVDPWHGPGVTAQSLLPGHTLAPRAGLAGGTGAPVPHVLPKGIQGKPAPTARVVTEHRAPTTAL